MDLTPLGNEVLKEAPKSKSIQMTSECATLSDGSTLPPLPLNTPTDALRATLLMLFKHVADVHVTIVEILAEKMKLSPDEIHQAITSDPRWTAMLTNPLITDLTQTVWEKATSKPKRKLKIISTEELVLD